MLLCLKASVHHDFTILIFFFKGIVYLGTLHGTPVAVKVPKKVTTSFEKLQHEIGLMGEIRHPNVLCFLGTLKTQHNGLYIITEYIDGGIVYTSSGRVVSVGWFLDHEE